MALYSASPNTDSCNVYCESKKRISLRSGFMIYNVIMVKDIHVSLKVIRTKSRAAVHFVGIHTLLEYTWTNKLNYQYMYYVVFSNSVIPLHRERSVLVHLPWSNMERLKSLSCRYPPNINEKCCHYADLRFCDTIRILYSLTGKLAVMLSCVSFHVGTTNMSSI